ncbi:hypothetical protein [Candidatus Enterovibrio altilux]|uniref:hypothetical protein n=1 Tax=Candidatus Enterovibrio altilux TaxID=1927128 RepID=UPI0013747CDF|nr:hypothetical protein [Candidatus Enterovibrio luxaltus]
MKCLTRSKRLEKINQIPSNSAYKTRQCYETVLIKRVVPPSHPKWVIFKSDIICII